MDEDLLRVLFFPRDWQYWGELTASRAIRILLGSGISCSCSRCRLSTRDTLPLQSTEKCTVASRALWYCPVHISAVQSSEVGSRGENRRRGQKEGHFSRSLHKARTAPWHPRKEA